MVNSRLRNKAVPNSPENSANTEGDDLTFAPGNKLSSVEKRALRRKAHALKPVVMIGQQGLTDAVLAEVDVALNAHQLIKVRSRGGDQKNITAQSVQIKKQLNAEIVQKIGSVFVLYRDSKVSS